MIGGGDCAAQWPPDYVGCSWLASRSPAATTFAIVVDDGDDGVLVDIMNYVMIR